MLLWWDNRRRRRLWEKAMALCNVDAVEPSGFWKWRPQLTARSGSIEVRITGAGGDGVAVVVEGPEGFSDLKLRRQFLKLGKREIEVGDEAFDRAFLVEGPLQPAAVRFLDGTLRGQLLRASWVCNALEIGDGRLRVEVSEEGLPRILPVLFSIGRRLAEPLDVKSRLLHNARRDPKPAVRLFNLLILIREYPGDPDTLKVLRGACMDPISKVRVRAAIELGDEAVLLRIAETSSDDASCALALSHLSKLPFERVHDILARSLRKGARAPLHQTARACLEVLGRRGAAAIGILARVMTEEKGELATAAAAALGTTGEAAAEPHLLQALQSEDGGLRVAAAHALGRVGSAAAVLPLQEAAESAARNPELHRTARQAIAGIQARLEGASPGQLSLTQSETGKLSLATDPAGRLSLQPEEPGQSSQVPRKGPGVRRV